ncbi:MAG: FecR domain-containing protein [Candidatus Omnitrophica bacterium]|nr:FecR domain-containing protein [Candidatus Omnitrophota bacterium]
MFNINNTSHKQPLIRKYLNVTTLVVAAWFTLVPQTVHADDTAPTCRVLKVVSSAWIEAGNSSIKHTAKAGDIRKNDDILHVANGHYVQLALDDDEANVLHIEGEAVLQVEEARTRLARLWKGSLFAVLDHLGGAQRFEVMTPQAVAAVRGTYFGVFVADDVTRVTGFEGSVFVTANLSSTSGFFSPKIIHPAETVVASGPPNRVGQVSGVGREDFESITRVLGLLTGDRQPLSYYEALSALKARNGASAQNPRAALPSRSAVNPNSAITYVKSERDTQTDEPSDRPQKSGSILF